jgi:hypothetical protein
MGKYLESIKGACLIFAATGVFILMLKNPQDNFLNIPIFMLIMVTIALSSLNLKK